MVSLWLALAGGPVSAEGFEWETVEPQTVGLDRAPLDRMAAQIRERTDANVHSLLVIKGGKLAFEAYFAGQDEDWGRDLGIVTFDADTRHDLRSVSKSVTSALVGIAIAENRLPDLETPVPDLFPDYADHIAPDKSADLFVRDGRSIAPTHTAQYLAEELEPLVSSIHKTLENLKSFDPDTHRTFRVFVTEAMLYLLQAKFENNYTIGNCRIFFELSPRSTEEMFHALGVQRVDMAIDLSGDSYRSYRSEHVYTDEMVVVCARSHPRIQGSIDLEAYQREEHVGLVMRRSGQRAVDLYAKTRLDDRNLVFECESLISMFMMVSQGQMLCASTRALAEKYQDLFDLQVLPCPFETRPIEYFLIAHRRLESSPAHQWLRGILVEALEEL